MKIKQTLQDIARRSRDLNSSSRMLIGALFVILTMGLLMVANFAAKPSLVPLPVKTLSPEQRTEAISMLERRNIRHEEDASGRILVAADQQYTILGQLRDEELLEAGAIDFDSLIDQESPFANRDQTSKRWLTAKMNVTERMIASLDNVRSARVVISPGERGFNRSHVPPTATVTVVTRGGDMTTDLVDAVAEIVAGAHAGLEPQNVRITDANAGRPRYARSREDRLAGGYLEQQHKTETLVRDRIEQALVYIPGVLISVNALVDNRAMTEQAQQFEEPVQASLEERSRTESMRSGSTAREPGVRANTGLAITGAGAGGPQSSLEESEARLGAKYPQKSTFTRDLKGNPLKINATIGVPRSFFVQRYREQQGDAEAEPDDATLNTMVTPMLDQIQTLVEPLVDTSVDALQGTTAGQVVVQMVPDAGTGVFGGPGGTGAEAGWSSNPILAGGMIRTVGLGSLAVVSLAMMFMMVRKANVKEELPSVEELVGLPPALESEDADLVGEAGEAAPPMEGRELDEEVLQRKQMLSQINELVQGDPAEAATMLRRWIRSDGP